jgi:ribonuclease HII
MTLPWHTVHTIGIDEAGRGPLLGPMVMAAVCLGPRAAASLTRMGVKDSKSFGAGPDAHAARSELARKVLARAESVAIRVVDVAEIDLRVRLGQLNVLEREHAGELVVASAPAKWIIADGKRLFGPLKERFPQLRAVDGGESAHVAVAAASIVAKVRRDELWHCIAARYRAEFGELAGGGYTNAATRKFVRAFIRRYGRLPPEARRTWPWTFARDLLRGHDPMSELGPLPAGFEAPEEDEED